MFRTKTLITPYKKEVALSFCGVNLHKKNTFATILRQDKRITTDKRKVFLWKSVFYPYNLAAFPLHPELVKWKGIRGGLFALFVLNNYYFNSEKRPKKF